MFLRFLSSGAQNIGYAVQFSHGNICIPEALFYVVYAFLDSSRNPHGKTCYRRPVNVRFKCMCVLTNTSSLQGSTLLLWDDHYFRLFILYFQNQYRLYINGKSDSVSNKKQKKIITLKKGSTDELLVDHRAVLAVTLGSCCCLLYCFHSENTLNTHQQNSNHYLLSISHYMSYSEGVPVLGHVLKRYNSPLKHKPVETYTC